MNIVIIGAGNVGTNIAYALNKKHKVKQIVSKTTYSAQTLAKSLKTDFTTNLNKIYDNADIYFISTNDSSIIEIAKQLKIENKIIIHTAGSISADVLNNNNYNNYGVFYPLQTFSKNNILDFNNIPICIEAENIKTEKIILKLAKSISSRIYIINSEQRKYLHLSAVFACNFTNHLYNISCQILKDKGIDFNIIKPLIEETANKIINTNPSQAQTGPAVRNDKIIIEKHLELLSLNSNLQNIYKELTNNIIETRKKYGKF